jgi:hypothetical protein
MAPVHVVRKVDQRKNISHIKLEILRYELGCSLEKKMEINAQNTVNRFF